MFKFFRNPKKKRAASAKFQTLEKISSDNQRLSYTSNFDFKHLF